MPDGNLNNVGNGYLYAGDVDGDGLQDKITMWSGSERNNEQGYINVQFMTGSYYGSVHRTVSIIIFSKNELISAL